MYKVYIIVGQSNVESFKEDQFEDIDTSQVNCFKFKTVNEKGAFCGGIQLTADYDNYCFIDEDEYEKIINEGF